MAELKDDIKSMSLAGIVRSVTNRDISVAEITNASIENVKEIDCKLNSFIETTFDEAIRIARYQDDLIAKGGVSDIGILVGVPVGFKDNMNMIGTHTTCASKMLENYKSTYTATCVENILQEGGIPIGKLNMDEFAFGSSTETSHFGKTLNPHDISRVPGGSSGGSAAAVAAGLLPLSLGSDTGGSIRQPACFCGVVGVKPTYGRVSRYGVVAFGSSLDQVGPFTRSVEDACIAMNALCGKDERDCTSQACNVDFTDVLNKDAKGMKVGIVKSFMEAEGLHSEVKEKIEEAAKVLETSGAELIEIELPHAASAISAYYVLGPCEAFSNLARFDSVRYGYRDEGHKDLNSQYEASRHIGFGEEARRRIFLGSYLLSAGLYDKYYYPAQQVRTLITQDYNEAFRKVDVILAPSSPRTAFKFGDISEPTEMYLADMFTISINIASNGGMNFPVGVGKTSGLPVGVQLICPAFKDENMLLAASALERHYGHPLPARLN